MCFRLPIDFDLTLANYKGPGQGHAYFDINGNMWDKLLLPSNSTSHMIFGLAYLNLPWFILKIKFKVHILTNNILEIVTDMIKSLMQSKSKYARSIDIFTFDLDQFQRSRSCTIRR